MGSHILSLDTREFLVYSALSLCTGMSSKRRNVCKPVRYVFSEDEERDDEEEDFVIPSSKRAKSSQSSQEKKPRAKASDRILDRDLKKARELSMQSCKKETASKSDSNKENLRAVTVSTSTSAEKNLNNTQSSESQSSPQVRTKSETLDTHPIPSLESEGSKSNKVDSAVGSHSNLIPSNSSSRQPPNPEKEFEITEIPDHDLSSEDDFQISPITDSGSEEHGSSSDEEFRLSAEECKTSKKKRTKKKPKCSGKQSNPSKNKVTDSGKSGCNVTKKSVPTTNKDIVKSIIPSKCSGVKAPKPVSSRPAKASGVNPAQSGGVKTPNILSQQGGIRTSPGAIRIGLSKNAKFKSLHANVKRP